MVSAFGDESFDETQQRIFAIAAVFGQDQEWERVEKSWKERTGDIPFHATDCESDHGDYVGFPHAQNKALYRDLATILSESNLWGWGAAFDLASWREISPTVDQDLSYLRGFFTVVSEVEEYSKLQFNDVVKFTFDSRERSNYCAGKI